MKSIIVFCTLSSMEEGEKIYRIIVEEKMAACCSRIPKVNQLFSLLLGVEASI